MTDTIYLDLWWLPNHKILTNSTTRWRYCVQIIILQVLPMIHSRPFKIHLLAPSLIYMNPKVKIHDSHWSITIIPFLGCYLDQSDGEDPDDVPELRSFHKLQDAGLVRMRTRQIEARIRRKKSRRKKVSHQLHCNTGTQSGNTAPSSIVILVPWTSDLYTVIGYILQQAFWRRW